MMKLALLTLSLLLSLPAAILPQPDSSFRFHHLRSWRRWQSRYQKVYDNPFHEAKAHMVWLHHWYLVQSHNSRSDVTFTLELNAFADQEFRRERNTNAAHPLRFVPEVMTRPTDMTQPPPESFDWRPKGVIPPVHNQGHLGSADAYAVTDDLESLHALNTGQLVELSVAEVVDCCSAGSGMLVPDIYECVARHGGLCSASAYPTHHPPPAVCRNSSCHAVAKDAKVTMHVPRGDEDAMVTALLKRPLVVRVDAGHSSFQLYKAGVYRDADCTHQVDHSMQLVGYGVQNNTTYWILKNSWGADWGMRGYMLMERGVNMCGVAEDVIYPQ